MIRYIEHEDGSVTTISENGNCMEWSREKWAELLAFRKTWRQEIKNAKEEK